MGSLQVYLFRDFCVTFDGEPVSCLEAKKARELFSYLLLNQARPQRRQWLMTLLWEESDQVRAQKYLRQALWQIQSSLSPHLADTSQKPLQVDADWVQVDPLAGIWCDAVQLQKAFYSTQGTAGEVLDSVQAHMLQQAVALYRGDLLECWYENWCLVERENLQNMYLMMLDKLIDCCETRGRYEEGIVYCMRALKQDYARERTHSRLMRLYYLHGDRSSALRQYEQCAAALRAELDVAPSQQTERLRDLIRRDALAGMSSSVSLGGEAHALPLGELVDRLIHLDTTLGEVRSVVQRDMQAVERLLQSRS